MFYRHILAVMARPEQDQTGIRTLNMVGSKTYAVSLPIDVVKVLGWQKGTKLIVRRQGDKLLIEKLVEGK